MGAKTSMSPLQPRRSSRAGVSVGTERKFPRCPEVMLRCSWFNIGESVAKVSVAGASVCITRPVPRPRGGGTGEAGDLDAAEAVEGEAGLVRLGAAALEDAGVGRLRGFAVRRFAVQSVPSGLRTSACRSRTTVPAGPFTRSRTEPAMLRPRSNTNTPGLRLGDTGRCQFLGDPYRGVSLRHDPLRDHPVRLTGPQPVPVIEPRRGPDGSLPAGVIPPALQPAPPQRSHAGSSTGASGTPNCSACWRKTARSDDELVTAAAVPPPASAPPRTLRCACWNAASVTTGGVCGETGRLGPAAATNGYGCVPPKPAGLSPVTLPRRFQS